MSNDGVATVETGFVPEMEIVSNNVSYSDSVYLLYAVKTNGDFPMEMLFWDDTPTAYKKGTESYATEVKGTVSVKGELCKVFYSEGLSAKRMSDSIYCCAYTTIGDKAYYSEPIKYSVVDYVYTKLEQGVKERTEKLLVKMLEYGSAAQGNFSYHTERPADGAFYQVFVENGTLDDGYTYGRYIENATVTLKAPATDADGILLYQEKLSKRI